ncbi:response regulator [Flavihumibacter petaseus]|nr:response regulator transcription factor [Flavihumibacter petaseus]
MAVRIIAIDDHQVVIDGLTSMLTGAELDVVFTTTNADALLSYLEQGSAEVLFLDIQMPGVSGIDLCRQIRKLNPDLRIIAFSSFDESHLVKQMMRSGASGYLLKNADKQTVIKAIETVMAGEEFLDETIKDILLKESLTGQRRSIFDIPLTNREKEILKLIAEGLSNQEIADRLYISLRTVETHRLNLSQKLSAKNTAMLVKEAIRRGLVE